MKNLRTLAFGIPFAAAALLAASPASAADYLFDANGDSQKQDSDAAGWVRGGLVGGMP